MNAENTAPGEDRLTYKHIRATDPEAKLTTALMNLIRKAGRIPQAWRRSQTVLIYKKGELDNIKNWRPIALGPTLCKLYTGLWATRLNKWVEENGALSKAQKGFRPFDGVLEHNYTLLRHIERARAGKEDMALALLDLQNAFGSMPHRALQDALLAIGAGEAFTNIVTDVYNNNTTRVLTSRGPTGEIPITRGIRQGCPLSGTLQHRHRCDRASRGAGRDRARESLSLCG